MTFLHIAVSLLHFYALHDMSARMVELWRSQTSEVVD